MTRWVPSGSDAVLPTPVWQVTGIVFDEPDVNGYGAVVVVCTDLIPYDEDPDARPDLKMPRPASWPPVDGMVIRAEIDAVAARRQRSWGEIPGRDPEVSMVPLVRYRRWKITYGPDLESAYDRMAALWYVERDGPRPPFLPKVDQ